MRNLIRKTVDTLYRVKQRVLAWLFPRETTSTSSSSFQTVFEEKFPAMRICKEVLTLETVKELQAVMGACCSKMGELVGFDLKVDVSPRAQASGTGA
jgi:hypothetical protein